MATLVLNERVDTWIPFILLILLGLSIFLSEKHDGGCIDNGISGSTSAHGMTLSKSLMSGEHFFFMYSSRKLENDHIAYNAYNRFPLIPFFLTGLLTHPFRYNLSLQLYIARQIMNLFFLLSIIIAYKTLKTLLVNNFLALTISLICFSSYYMFSFNDMIFNDMPALFGFLLAIYCVVLFEKIKPKFSQILFFSFVPIILGWQPFAVFGSWLFVTFINLMVDKKIKILHKCQEFIAHPSFKISILAISIGILILGLQLVNEWRIVGGQFIKIPSLNSALWRSGIASSNGHSNLIWTMEWANFLPSQCHTIFIMLIPFWPVFQIEPGLHFPILFVISISALVFIQYIKNKSLYYKVILILLLSGFFWSIPMKNFVALHDFQSIYYIGFSIGIYILFLTKINVRKWKFVSINLTLVFMISISLSNYYKSPFSSNITQQFQEITNKLSPNSRVYYDGELKGNTRFIELFLTKCIFTNKDKAEYLITPKVTNTGIKLTTNSKYNLYRLDNK